MALEQEFPVILDYLTFSCYFSSFEEAVFFLGLGKYFDRFVSCNGRYSYMYGLSYMNTVMVYMSQKSDFKMCCIEISGQGCRIIESLSCRDIEDILRDIHTLDGFRLTRVDVAMDIVGDSINIKRLVKDTRNNNYICRSKFRNIMESVNDGVEGVSLYFGKKGSNIFVNIYDKRAERGYKPEDMPAWTRIEIRLRHENAQGFLIKYFECGCDIGFLYSGILNNYLRFLKPSKTDINRSRWETAPYWGKLLSTTEKVKVFYKPGVEYNFSKFESDLIIRCGSSIKTFFELGYTPYELKRLIDVHGIELNAKQQALVDSFVFDDIEYLIL